MRKFNLHFFAIEIFLLVQISLSSSKNNLENQTLCEIWYQNFNHLNCLRQYGKNISADVEEDSFNFQTYCKDESSSEDILPPDITAYVFHVWFISCPLRPGVFQHLRLPLLKSFTIDPRNKHTVIKNNTFFGLCSVSFINAKKTGIETIEPAAFKCLKSVTKLYLSGNNLKSLPPGVFAYMPNLEILHLKNNNLSALPEGIFDSLYLLSKLFLNQNSLHVLPYSIFGDLWNLRYLKLGNNNLEFSNKDVFFNLRNLWELDLRHTKIKDSRGLFSNVGVFQLNLGWNADLVLRSDSFEGLQSLNTLFLDKCNVNSLPDGIFNRTRSVQTLTLSEIGLQEINTETFYAMTRLLNLDLSLNDIVELKNLPFKYNIELVTLKLGKNAIEEIEKDTFKGLSFLKELDLSSNRLKNLENCFSGLTSLRKLNISHNFVSELFQSPPFQSFLITLENLIEFDASNNTISTLSNVFLNNKKLLKLFISRNPLLGLDRDLLNGLSVLETLHMDYCNIEYLPHGMFENTPNLKNLNAQGNHLRQIESTSFSELQYLLFLDLSYNEISSMEKQPLNINEIPINEFQVPKELRYLGLKNNKLDHLPATIQNHSKGFEDFNLTLSGNLWTCDCSLLPFKTFVSEYRIQIEDVDQIYCTFSDGAESVIPLKEMEYSDLCPYTQYILTIILLSSLGVVVLTASIASSVMYYKHKMHILAYLYTHANPCYMFCCSRPEDEEKLFDCFISYSSTDREVAHKIVEELEDPIRCKFCIHERNWISGKFITANIVDSIQNSRKTLIILSKEFLKSEWFHMEFQAAYHQTLKDKKDRLILVLFEELPDKSEMENDLQYVISTKTYLEWGEKWFWEKLRYSIHEEHYFLARKKKNRLLRFLGCYRKIENVNEEFEMNEVT